MLPVNLMLNVARVGSLDPESDGGLWREPPNTISKHTLDFFMDFDGLLDPVAGGLDRLEFLHVLGPVAGPEHHFDVQGVVASHAWRVSVVHGHLGGVPLAEREPFLE